MLSSPPLPPSSPPCVSRTEADLALAQALREAHAADHPTLEDTAAVPQFRDAACGSGPCTASPDHPERLATALSLLEDAHAAGATWGSCRTEL